MPKSQIRETLKNTLDPERHLVPLISAKIDKNEFDVLFLTGIERYSHIFDLIMF